MIPKLLGIILLSSTALAQFNALKPDVSFDNNNDRFDLTDMWASNKMSRDTPEVDEDDDDSAEIEYRRHFHDEDNFAPLLLDILKKKDPGNIFLTRKADGGFAYHDRMDSSEGGNKSEFEENLKHFQIKAPRRRNPDYEDNALGFRKVRRMLAPDVDSDVLMHHALPIVLKVDGFLKAPLK